MQAGAEHQRRGQLWLITGTGEGPALAGCLIARGWRVRVFVVSAAAARAYGSLPGLEITVGALGEADAIEAALERAETAGSTPRWLVDATHPFASRISAALAIACRRRGMGLLRLLRPLLEPGEATVLGDLEALRRVPLAGRSLLLAIGARQLGSAIASSPGALHHARILPNPAALAAAMAAGLPPQRIAPLRPDLTDGRLERALCRRWGIEAVLCRRSGSGAEALWHQLARSDGLKLLLLERPAEPAGVRALPLADLLGAIGEP